MKKQTVAELIKDIAENFKVEAKNQFIDYRMNQIARHEIGEGGSYLLPYPKSGFDYTQKEALERINSIMPYLETTKESLAASPVDLGYEYRVSSYQGITVYVAKENLDELLENDAIKYAKEVVEHWQYKQIEKYNEIVDSKKGVKGKVIKFGSLTNNSIRFEWEDGSGFTVQNQITYCTSNKGTYFNRFPTTFHNVTLVGGEKVKQPSEAKVKKLFINKDVKPANAPVVHWATQAYFHKGKTVAQCSGGSRMGEQRFLYGYSKATEDKSQVTCKRCLKAIEKVGK